MQEPALLVLNGPGLADLSDSRYGNLTLEQVRNECSALCEQLGVGLEFRQTDDVEEMLRWISNDSGNFAALIINPIGYAATGTVDIDSYLSAIEMIAELEKPVVEVHMTNIFHDDSTQARPMQGPDDDMGFVCGLGVPGYLLAIKAVEKRLQN